MTTSAIQKEPQKVCSGEELLELREIAQAVPIAKAVIVFEYLT